MADVQIAGMLAEPRRNAQGAVYRGRFTCPDVQWTGTGDDLFATFTITAGELADAAASNMLWTDQDVQRGIQPAAVPRPPRELSLADGYPEPSRYIFDGEKADDIAQKLLGGDQLFLSPLIWNLRPSNFEAYWNESEEELYLYKGKIYLPDSHHRHQAIVKAVETWRDAQNDFPMFSDSRQFKVELYFLSREDEGNYFFDKNQRTKPTAKSKAYDLTTEDDLSLLAKRTIDESKCLRENVNRVTDRLSAQTPQVMTLSTLREMMRTFASSEHIDSSELDGLAKVAAEFYDMLAEVRPELGRMTVPDRRQSRSALMVDAAVMMHGYAALMKEFNLDMARVGPVRARDLWRGKLQRFRSDRSYSFRGWQGDLFDRANPLWAAVGLTRVAEGGKMTVLNTGAARSEAGRVLRQLALVDGEPIDLAFVARRS